MSFRLEGEEQERKLFVGGLNKASTDEDQLKSYFEQFGNIIDCTIMRDTERQSRGFGFVLFEDTMSVDKIMNAKKEGHEFTIDDNHIEIKRALPKVPGGTAGSSRTGGLYRKVFVGGLPSSITEDDLKTYFERYGRVNEVELLRDRETNRLRGFAFVTFEEEDSADKCIQRRSHEICKKICEVKRAQTRSNLGKEEERRSGFDRERIVRPSNEPQGGVPSTMTMTEVNQLIQQAFVMGQQSVQPGITAPTAASLLNGTSVAAPCTPAVNNVLLQALMNQTAPPAPSVPLPIVPSVVPPAPANNSGALNQLAQILQNRGLDANALSTLLNKEPAASAPSPSKPTSNNYSTTYPSVSSYDYSYNNKQSLSYGPSKDEDPKRGYRPY